MPVNFVAVDLRAGTARGRGLDRLTGIDNVDGSRFDDDLRGDSKGNYIFGGSGDDAMYGRGGFDTLFGDSGHDLGSGGPDRDSCDPDIELMISCTRVTD